MGLVSKTAKVKPRGISFSYYKNKGYVFNLGDEIDVKVEDLSTYAKAKIQCTCDYCGDLINMAFSDYNLVMNSGVPKISCKKCYPIKQKESNLLKYGVENPMQLQEVKGKAKKTCLEKYGKGNYTQTEEYRKRCEQTCLEKYGVKNPMQNKDVRQKVINTNLKKYGVEAPMQSQVVKDKTMQTFIDHFGTANPQSLPEIKEKYKKTMLERYGVDNPSQSEEILERKKDNSEKKYGTRNYQGLSSVKNKRIETNMQRYGETNCMKIPEVKKKLSITLMNNQTARTSIQQKYIHQLYGGVMNGVVSYFKCDIVLEDEKLICEYDGGGHNLCVKLDKTSQDEFNKSQLIRDTYIKSEGYRIIRIISRKDYLPSDSTLLSMLSYARTFFSANPERTWISFDVDNSCIYNAYYKEQDGGLHYDFGPLRKIKKSDLQETA